jgi:hypothetical protein
MYCAFYNMTWLQLEETMRVDVRVYWRRRATDDIHNLRGDCGAGARAVMDGDRENISSFTRTVTIVRNDTPPRGLP